MHTLYKNISVFSQLKIIIYSTFAFGGLLIYIFVMILIKTFI